MSEKTVATNYPHQARKAVLEYILGAHARDVRVPDPGDYGDDVYEDLHLDDIYVVSFTYALGHWKAMVSTTIEDNKYYEVTCGISENRTFVDEYTKTGQWIIEGTPEIA